MTGSSRSLPAEPSYGTCDWGGCDKRAIHWRWSKALAEWLPVCRQHTEGDGEGGKE
jgi:hypothetical protein